jgi:hypothetical protein
MCFTSDFGFSSRTCISCLMEQTAPGFICLFLSCIRVGSQDDVVFEVRHVVLRYQ